MLDEKKAFSILNLSWYFWEKKKEYELHDPADFFQLSLWSFSVHEHSTLLWILQNLWNLLW